MCNIDVKLLIIVIVHNLLFDSVTDIIKSYLGMCLERLIFYMNLLIKNVLTVLPESVEACSFYVSNGKIASNQHTRQLDTCGSDSTAVSHSAKQMRRLRP